MSDAFHCNSTLSSNVSKVCMHGFSLKYGFCKKSLRKKETLNSCTFYLHKKVPVLMNHNIWKKLYVMIHYCRYLFVKMKVFNYSELHFSEVTSYKIHTLVVSPLVQKNALVQVYHSWKKIYFVHSYKSRIEHSQIVSN